MLCVTENKCNLACSYIKTDKCMNEFDGSVNEQTNFEGGGGRNTTANHDT